MLDEDRELDEAGALSEEDDDDGQAVESFYPDDIDDAPEAIADTSDDDDDDDEGIAEAAKSPNARNAQPASYPEPPCYVTVVDGDCIKSLSVRYGIPLGRIWYASENNQLRQWRKLTQLLPGDKVFIPAKEIKHVSGATDATHIFRLRQLKSRLRIRLLKNFEARPNLPFTLIFDGQNIAGVTDDDGQLDVPIPTKLTSATLRVVSGDREEIYRVNIGHLDPADAIHGVQGRLSNLGFSPGPVDGDARNRTRDAISAFQQAQGITINGRVNAQLVAKLEEVHGS